MVGPEQTSAKSKEIKKRPLKANQTWPVLTVTSRIARPNAFHRPIRLLQPDKSQLGDLTSKQKQTRMTDKAQLHYRFVHGSFQQLPGTD